MNKYQKWLTVSIVLLATSLIMPIYVLYTALGSTLQTAVNVLPDYSSSNPATGSISSFLQNQQTAQLQLLTIVIAVEAVLVASFAVTLWYTIKCRDQCRTYPTI